MLRENDPTTILTLPCDFDTGKKIARRYAPIRLFTLYNEETRPLSSMVRTEANQTFGQESPTSLDLLHAIYARHGLTASSTPPLPAPSPLEPVLVAPDFVYFKLYHMLGVDSATLEAMVREFVPDFTLDRLFTQICLDYKVPLEHAFPSQVDLHLMITGGADTTVNSRVVPVFMMPLLLTLLPECYQSAGQTLFELEQVQYRLPHCIPSQQYSTFVSRQVFAIGQNRRYIGFLYQNAFHCHSGPLRDSERLLYEADITALEEVTRKGAALASKQRQKILRLMEELTDQQHHHHHKKRRRRGS